MLFARKLFRLDRYVRVPAILFFRNLGLGMALLLTMSACGASIQGSISNPTATPSAPIRHELANPTDTALARTVLLRPSELPAGWTPVGQEDDTAADLTNNRFCVSDYPAYVAGSFIAYSFRLDPKTNYEQGHLAVWIRMTDSDADAQRQLDLLSSPKADTAAANQCWLEGYKTLIAEAVGPDNLLPGPELLPKRTLTSPLSGLILRASVPYRFLNADKVIYFDDIRIQKGRIVARLLFQTCCKPFSYAPDEAPEVEAVAKRMVSASADVTA